MQAGDGDGDGPPPPEHIAKVLKRTAEVSAVDVETSPEDLSKFCMIDKNTPEKLSRYEEQQWTEIEDEDLLAILEGQRLSDNRFRNYHLPRSWYTDEALNPLASRGRRSPGRG